MVDLYIHFTPRNKEPLDVINKLCQQLELCLQRTDIEEYGIAIGDTDVDNQIEDFHILIHEEIKPSQEDESHGEH